MMKMKRIISLTLALLLLVLPILSLTACHGPRERIAFDIPDNFDPDASYEITFWAKTESHDSQAAAYQNAVSEFNKYYPNIKVKLVIYSNYEDIYMAALANIQTGTTPNICISYPDHVATYISGEDVVVPLDSLIAHEEYGLGGSAVRFDAPTADEMVDKFLDEGKIDGIQYLLPYMRSTEACYVNKNMVEALGYTLPESGILTWDFVWEVSRAAMAKNEDGTYKLNGQKTLIPFVYKSTDNMMIQMLEQLDAGYTTDGGEALLFNDTTKEILLTVGEHAALGAFSTFNFSRHPGNFLNAGQCIFAIDSTAGATWIGQNSPHLDIDRENVVEFETVVLPIPQYNTNKPEMISQGPSFCLFNKEDPGEVMASWLFAQFLLTNRVQIEYAKTEGYIPVTEKAHNSAEYQAYINHEGDKTNEHYSVKLDATRLLLNNIENTFITPVFNGSSSVRKAAGEMIDEVNAAPRRKIEVTPEFIEELFEKKIIMHKLDVNIDKGLPTGSVVLLISLGVSWISIGVYVAYTYHKKRKRENN